MGNYKGILRNYWIFLVTLIFYCIGISVHFIAQKKGPYPHKGKDILEKVSSQTETIIDFSNKNNDTAHAVDSNESIYSKPDNLFYFVQISDVHMSSKYTRGSQGHLYYFFKKMIPIIDPNFLFITGDITDSLTKGLSIKTLEEDWIMYRKIIEETGVDTKNNGTFLWDIRGNHDCFMIPEWDSEYNYYKDYSHTKTRGFSFNYNTDYGSYSFVGLDGCPILTTINPFFGIIDEVMMENYGTFMEKSKDNTNNKHNFVLNHYPETVVKFGKSYTGKEWNNYTKDISLLLSGHLHTIGGQRVYAYHKDFLELEISDFKLHGRYRIVSVDHDVVNFSDKNLPLPSLPFDFKESDIDKLIKNPPEIFNKDIPPIVHITLPKDSRFNLKKNEPVKESYASDYVRVLVFSSLSPADLNLSLYIDDVLQEAKFQYVGDQKLTKRSKVSIQKRDSQHDKHTIQSNTPPLWVAKWNNTIFDDGKSHTLKVVVKDKQGNTGDDSISFRVDGESDAMDVPVMTQFILKSVLVKSLPVLFGIVFILFEIAILLSRWYFIKNIIPKHPDIPFLPTRYIGDMISEEIKHFKEGGFFKRHYCAPFIEAFTFNGVFYPIQILLICLLVLPAKIGVMTRSSENVSSIGGEFLYGSYISGQWSNVYDQYGLYLLYFIFFPILDTFIICSLNKKNEPNRIITILLLSFLFFIQVALCMTLSMVFGGILAVFLAPYPNWICFYSWTLIYIIIIRRFKQKSNKPVTPELVSAQAVQV
ncbi:Metallo-dependent phosphatase [Piromyces finnis]|uniref:Metallo-dependent phosphatase n=1 Tax=Piromyces finnis TaxID=1754191 RepID=A0A1Y1V926_9FUNG|nr:Metallo-dependent phosphatase [Piromyces finnis]|eukprot:ORX50046.1 Metallo-dependent phosphatase [Piromyces finnis]